MPIGTQPPKTEPLETEPSETELSETEPSEIPAAAGLQRIRGWMSEGKQPPIARLLGMRLLYADPGRAVMEMEAGPHLANPVGTVHGGVLCDLADAAMGMAYYSQLQEGESFTTLELKMNFLKPVWKGRLRAEATILKQGRTVGLVECRIVDEGGSLVAHSTSTCMTLRGQQAQGR